MKTVFSKTQEVCAAWAAQAQPHGRTSSNTSFEGQTLYSYGTPIAEIIVNAGGAVLAALVSSQRWSDGTSKVQGEARSEAHKAGIAVFVVPHINPAGNVSANLGDYEVRIEDAIESTEKAVRWDTAARHRQQAMALIGEAAMFARTFCIAWSYTGRNPMLADGKDRKEGF